MAKKRLFVLLGILVAGVPLAVLASVKNPVSHTRSQDYSASSTLSGSTASVPKSYRSVSYEDLARDMDGMSGKYIKVTGQIIQVQDFGDVVQGRISITHEVSDFIDYYTDPILFEMPSGLLNQRLLEDDIVTFCGQSEGYVSYTTIAGADTSAPCIYVSSVDFVG
mgnify:FL=1